jgi:hypothetical protein
VGQAGRSKRAGRWAGRWAEASVTLQLHQHNHRGVERSLIVGCLHAQGTSCRITPATA